MADILSFRDDVPLEEPAVTLDAFLDQSNATSVRLEDGEDVRQLLPFLDRLALIEVGFSRFGDGRGYSAARVLREHGFTGELRAQGDILVDQLSFMLRCGFDSFAPETPLDAADTEIALSRWKNVYQEAADDRQPIWSKRHG
ncbi:DUF934 domain-containing protein [Parasphingopyxis sp. CP4]|uniref:DUF934 domain-containing protein n=1 Tax=Parasphingopyxis sp. CP4 TaxID=2724527 RepID=UPI0015A31819|nr:DUF934 domain-containing protein [Parasphingopyxis sp. CP4]QLC21268.1 DUF934 domain-containing protein [Parasphingopyxis sp. CP4]